MKIQRTLSGLAALLAATLVPIAVSKAEGLTLPNVVYDAQGTIDHIDVGRGTIVVDDHGYLLPGNIQIHAGERLVTVGALRKGLNVGIKTSTLPEGPVQANEIWILR